MSNEVPKEDVPALSFRRLNMKLDREIEWAAEVYCDSPRFWINNWRPSVHGMIRVMSRLREALNSDEQLILVAEVAPEHLVGFHWVVMEQVEPRAARYSGYLHDETSFLCARRVSLWVQEEWWNRGIATQLMTMGERWARSNGALKITASVHFRNTKMLNLNLKRGFEAGMVEMSKDLSIGE